MRPFIMYPYMDELYALAVRLGEVPYSLKEKPKLPRAPLPKQTGGPHKVKTKVLPRKRKHKKPGNPDWPGHIEGD